MIRDHISKAREKPSVPGWDGLPIRLKERLARIATAYRAEGVELFLFGSFARGDNRRTSDLDLGLLWHREPSRRLFNRLSEEIEELPSIRKVDLVDMNEASPELRRIALAEKKPLAREND